ncbi:hypothetical protein [Roseateles puraquae]|uniref:Phosphatidic acid phosphatase type 2/haloperoxidase domain-containing protein n=1 Tax=Roseateles puraquae TaxID=431059 RepID=A0A254N095_9BURK|nr:hypothetical protein [Roseateles puraquae]MDG0855256.1 hypothetical protein [Roseateles puraquae]MDG0855329.1 hypothetical protein [Roseateles puraquae]OWR01756.1 hypothetical protein CDO81_23620 [Roseateles puraquae]
MEESRESYAWIKTVMDDKPGPISSPCSEPRCSSVAGQLNFMSGDRPPFQAATLQATLTREATVVECCDAGFKRIIASSAVYGAWSVDSIYSGYGGVSFEVIQFVGTRQEAIEWLHTSAGKAWRSDAVHCALLRYEQPGASEAPVGVQMKKFTLPGGFGGFREDQWRSDYLEIARKGTRDPGLWLSQDNLRALWEGLQSQITDELGKAAGERSLFPTVPLTEAEKSRIRQESSDIAALRTVIAGTPTDDLMGKPNSMELLERVRREVRPYVFQLKLMLGRSRPWQDRNPPELAIQPGEPLFPAHASLPAGHAVLAYTLAELLEQERPVALVDYRGRAKAVAENRVKAGLHWPSDLPISAYMARHLADALAADPRMQRLLAKVNTEWAVPAG